jgi:hypothetical protein
LPVKRILNRKGAKTAKKFSASSSSRPLRLRGSLIG